MKPGAKRVIIFSIGLVLLTAVAVGFYMYNRGPVNIRTSKAIDVSATGVYEAYLADSASARKLYDGKVLNVKGEVSEITKNSQNQQVIKLKTSTDGGYVNCTLEEEVEAAAGQNIVLKGICSGMGQGDPDLGIPGDVYLSRSISSK